METEIQTSKQNLTKKVLQGLNDRLNSFRNKFGRSHLDINNKYQRDYNLALGYPQTKDIDYEASVERFRRGDIAKTLVSIYPEEVWNNEITITQDRPDAKRDTQFDRDIATLIEKHNVWSVFKKADILARLGRYSVILVGVRGDTNLSVPIKKLKSVDDIIYLKAYSEKQAIVEDSNLIADPSDSRFGLPASYKIQLNTKLTKQREVPVHFSRCIHVVSDPIFSDTYGEPILRAGWNRLLDLDKIVGGGAEAAWLRANPGILFDLDPEMELDANEEALFDAEIDNYVHKLSRELRLSGVKVEQLKAEVHDFGPNAQTILTLLAATYKIPLRILLGSERGELASSIDLKTFNDRLRDYELGHANALIRYLIEMLFSVGTLTRVRYKINWPRREDTEEATKADMTRKFAQANRQHYEATGQIILTADQIRKTFLGLDPLSETDLATINPPKNNSSTNSYTPTGGTKPSAEDSNNKNQQ